MAPSVKLTVKEAGLRVNTPEPAYTSTSARPPNVKAQDSAHPLNPSPTGSDEIKKLEPDTLAQPAQGAATGADPSTSTPSSTSSAKSARKRTPTPKAAAAPAAQKKTRGIKAPAAKQVKNNSRSPKRKADELEDDDSAPAEDGHAASPTKIKKLRLSSPKKPVRGKTAATTIATCSITNPPLSTAVKTKLTAVEEYIRDHNATPSLTFEPNTHITTVFRHDVFTALNLLNVHFELSNVEHMTIDLGNLIIETVEGGGVHEDWDGVKVELSFDTTTGEAIREKLVGHELRNCPFLMWELDRLVMERGAHTLLGAVDPRRRYESGLRDPSVATYAEEGPIEEAASFAGLGGFRSY
ncbi:hypothetical protein LTR95_007928 [Oleoguttula sp. CCFEE 5521]